MLPQVEDWLRRRTSSAADWPVEELLEAKGGTTVSVVLPARDERETVGEIVAAIRRDLVDGAPLVDEVIVVDSRSTDDTAAVAAAAGALVVAQDDVLPQLPPMSGKGEALWKSMHVARGDLLVFVDADLRDFTSAFVAGLLGPLLTDPSVGYVKACYDRPFVNGGTTVAHGGGRVTELVARPLINMHWPLLAGVLQPLGGEYAGRRALLERLPFVTGYGVELGLLVDVLEYAGLDAIAQVDLGTRVHRHQSAEALGGMSGQIMQTAWSRLERQGRVVRLEPPSTTLTQFRRVADGHEIRLSDVAVGERPPVIEVADHLRSAV
ncbi:glucosyl-3-phosphoglycerate synthase [Actinoallomurus iriomotensis]|uniref:Glucosyl-3-phosphoglycerate synthase n=1 Tax=Actinoallomurus iriomotensis TaxID=478107 RepID=A0A9W6RGL1_9ACTN|nr:glucosyl-3-phosphoglycerate synthase [Actinoallomurus iriomotensis]GLY75378.1 glucosyl-3-phosphoglycerate synthase [Actinoallomurus iriomotensis]